MWLLFSSCPCPKNLSPQLLGNQNMNLLILAIFLELSDFTCRWIVGMEIGPGGANQSGDGG